jgi:hypothetical protein
VSLYESLSSIVEEADRWLIENDNFEGAEAEEEGSVVKRA